MPNRLYDHQTSPAMTPTESRLRLQTIVRLRWFALLGQLITVCAVYFGLRFELPIGPCLLFIAISAWLNVYLGMRYPGRHRLSPVFATTLLAYDLVQLAALLYLTGGIENPFIMLIVAPVTVSAATLPGRNTIVLGVIAVVLAGVLVRYHLPLPWSPDGRPVMPQLYLIGFFAAIVACTTFLAIYAWRLSNEARQMSVALTATELVLAREQQLHALDGLAAAAAHELGTPLGTIVLVSKELGNHLPADSPLWEDLQLMRGQAERCREILQKLTKRPSDQDPMHLHVTLRQIIDEAADPHRNGQIRITYELMPIDGARNKAEPHGERNPGLIYGLGNLIENAVDFARSEVQIRASWGGGIVLIEVIDDGPGFAGEVFDHVGEPYVTTRPSNKGTGDQTGLGLGFFIAKTLLERSGASLEFDNRSEPEHGAIVRISWPRDAFEATTVLTMAKQEEEGQTLGVLG
ncbi:MAG: ActS/PrrB/RegB family redox-sensitive histidine kinase [Hyphomicrobiaceae bacterium]